MSAIKALTDELARTATHADARLYAAAVEGLYRGLWGRTTAQMREALKLAEGAPVYEALPPAARHLVDLAAALATEALRSQPIHSVVTSLALQVVIDHAAYVRRGMLSIEGKLGHTLLEGLPTEKVIDPPYRGGWPQSKAASSKSKSRGTTKGQRGPWAR